MLEEEVDAVAEETGFSGVVRVDVGDGIELAKAYGLADRGHEIPNTVDTQFGIASGTKGLTALAVASLIEEGVLELARTARSVLGEDLPLIDDGVTIEHLLSHRSGIGDYLDEEADLDFADYLMPVPVHELATTEEYLAVLDGHPAKFAPGRVTEPAEMHDTEFLRSDELPGRTALGYLDVNGAARTNVFHLPVRGSGDGGIYTTVADVSSFWRALFAGRIVSGAFVAELLKARSDVPRHSMRYGLGFWLHESADVVLLSGGDAGVSFRSVHDPARNITHTVISNTTEGARPIARLLRELSYRGNF